MTKCILCQTQIQEPLDLARFLRIGVPNCTGQRHTCSQCLAKFTPIGATKCPTCGRAQENNEQCFDCQRWQQAETALLENQALYQYDTAMSELMWQFKHYGDYELCWVFQDLLKQTQLPTGYDYYVPLPTDPKHDTERQFNTVTSIFEQSFPFTLLLRKLPLTKAQSQKNRQERMQTPQSFQYVGEKPVSGKILLLDDLYTTGRTLYHARNAMISACPDCTIKSFCLIRS